MRITDKTVDDIQIVAPAGRLDASSAAEIENLLNDLIDSARVKLVVSLAELEYISSSGLRVFLAALKRVRGQSGDLRLAALQSQVREVFDLAGFSSLFTITEDEQSAVESYKKLRS